MGLLGRSKDPVSSQASLKYSYAFAKINVVMCYVLLYMLCYVLMYVSALYISLCSAVHLAIMLFRGDPWEDRMVLFRHTLSRGSRHVAQRGPLGRSKGPVSSHSSRHVVQRGPLGRSKGSVSSHSFPSRCTEGTLGKIEGSRFVTLLPVTLFRGDSWEG